MRRRHPSPAGDSGAGAVVLIDGCPDALSFRQFSRANSSTASGRTISGPRANRTIASCWSGGSGGSGGFGNRSMFPRFHQNFHHEGMRAAHSSLHVPITMSNMSALAQIEPMAHRSALTPMLPAIRQKSPLNKKRTVAKSLPRVSQPMPAHANAPSETASRNTLTVSPPSREMLNTHPGCCSACAAPNACIGSIACAAC